MPGVVKCCWHIVGAVVESSSVKIAPRTAPLTTILSRQICNNVFNVSPLVKLRLLLQVARRIRDVMHLSAQCLLLLVLSFLLLLLLMLLLVVAVVVAEALQVVAVSLPVVQQLKLRWLWILLLLLY